MKKGLIGVSAVVLLGYLGGSLFFAGKAEDEFKHNIKVFDKALQDKMLQIPSSPQLNLVVKDYSRGIISSSAKLRIKVDLAGMPMRVPSPMKKMSYDLDLKINHGPFIIPLRKLGMAYVESSATLPEKIIEKAKQQLSKDSSFPQLDFNFLINLDKSSTFTTSVPAFTLMPKQFPGKFIWKGMNLTYNLSKELDNVQGSAIINGLDFSSPFGKAAVSKISMASNMSASDYGLWVGSGSFNIPSIAVSARGNSIFDLSNFKMDSSADIDNGLLNVGMNLSLESIVSMGQSFGPANIEFSTKNLDAKPLVEAQNILQQLKDAKNLPKDKLDELTGQLDLLFPQIVSKGAELSVKNASFKVPQGLLSADLNIKVPAGTKAVKSMELVNHVVAQGELSVPMVLVEKQLLRQAIRKVRYEQSQLYKKDNQAKQQTLTLEQTTAMLGNVEPVKRLSRTEIKMLAKKKVTHQLNKLVEKQLLIKKDDVYVLKFTFNKGHLSINGKAFTPDMLEQ